MTKAKPTSKNRTGKGKAPNEAQSGPYTKLLHEYVNELEQAVAEGCEVIVNRDGSETHIGYEDMDTDTKAQFLSLAVDYTVYVNRGLEPAHMNRVLDNIQAGKVRSRWLEGVLGDDLQEVPSE